jgi:hypothetical protein
MAELIAIRTFMKLKVLENIPETSSISLQNLAKATGVQDSLLGSTYAVPINDMKINRVCAAERMNGSGSG